MLYIARTSKEGVRVGIREIAKAIDSPEPFMAKILQDLSRKGLVLSIKGPNGGFYMDRTHLKISLADIVTAIDGDQLFTGWNDPELGRRQRRRNHPAQALRTLPPNRPRRGHPHRARGRLPGTARGTSCRRSRGILRRQDAAGQQQRGAPGAVRARAHYQGATLPLWIWNADASETVILVHGWEGRGAQLGAFVRPLVGAQSARGPGGLSMGLTPPQTPAGRGVGGEGVGVGVGGGGGAGVGPPRGALSAESPAASMRPG